uniref:Predicted protein n=1 Tax=Hordeum vulgare subsp. vulgare TaxID=112509 RepID=F2EEK8_HORVV|nr:predicted protein [Hordeum vulgare subsp. vulgare]
MNVPRGGAGGVARSDLAFPGAWSKPLQGSHMLFTIELLDLREGVIFAQLRCCSHIVIEVDCMELVDLWNSRSNTRSVVAPILKNLGN